MVSAAVLQLRALQMSHKYSYQDTTVPTGGVPSISRQRKLPTPCNASVSARVWGVKSAPSEEHFEGNGCEQSMI